VRKPRGNSGALTRWLLHPRPSIDATSSRDCSLVAQRYSSPERAPRDPDCSTAAPSTPVWVEPMTPGRGGRTEKDPPTTGTSPYGLPNH
jgi:hypothetical protein